MTALEPVSKLAFVPSGRTIFVANCEVMTIVSFWLAHTFVKLILRRSSNALRHVIGFADDGGV
jgi:hypothetical protein